MEILQIDLNKGGEIMDVIARNLFSLKNDIIKLTNYVNDNCDLRYNYVSAANNIIELLYGDGKLVNGNYNETLNDADIDYIREIFSNECFTFKDMNKFIKTQDMNLEDNRCDLINGCLWIPAILSLKYIGNGIDYSDLLQEGSFGIGNAICDYKRSSKSFSRLVIINVDEILKKYIRENGKYGNITKKQFEILLKLDDVKERVLALYEREVSNLYYADFLNYPYDSFEELMLKSCDSLDIDNIDDELNNHRTEKGIVDVEEEVLERFNYEDIFEACDLALNDREKFIIYHHFGINGCKQMNLTEIASYFGFSKERARFIVNLSLSKVKHKYKAILNKRKGLLSISDIKELRKNKIPF